MNNTIPKIITAIFWLVLIYNLIFPFSNPTLATTLYWTLICIVVVHIVEIVVFVKRIQASDAPALNALLVFIFGYFRATELPAPNAPRQCQ